MSFKKCSGLWRPLLACCRGEHCKQRLWQNAVRRMFDLEGNGSVRFHWDLFKVLQSQLPLVRSTDSLMVRADSCDANTSLHGQTSRLPFFKIIYSFVKPGGMSSALFWEWRWWRSAKIPPWICTGVQRQKRPYKKECNSCCVSHSVGRMAPRVRCHWDTCIQAPLCFFSSLPTSIPAVYLIEIETDA